MSPLSLSQLVKIALDEDIPDGDLTTDHLGIPEIPGQAFLKAKQDLVLSGTDAFNETFYQIDPEILIGWNFKDGDFIACDGIVCEVKGVLQKILKAERTALNFLGHLSGVATKTAQFVLKTKNTKAKITDTRKTLPGLRFLEKKAVVHGGGVNHRMNLSDAILIKENHIRTAGSITAAVSNIRRQNLNKSIEVEVTCEDEIVEACKLKVERLLLDNMSLADMEKAVKIAKSQCFLEASGNMRLDRIESVAKLGVDFISVGELTHSASNADLSLLFKTENK